MKAQRACAVVLDYDGAEKTEKCLTSLSGQGIQTAYVLDNSGSDGASQKLREALDRLQSGGSDYRIEILSAERNLDFAKGVNFVLAHDRRSGSPHDYYLLLNNDAAAGPGLVGGLIAALKEIPHAALVPPRIVSSDPGRNRVFSLTASDEHIIVIYAQDQRRGSKENFDTAAQTSPAGSNETGPATLRIRVALRDGGHRAGYRLSSGRRRDQKATPRD